MDKNLRDEIVKASWHLMESARDTTLLNVTKAARSAQIDVKPDQLQKLVLLIGSSLEEGYYQGVRSFGKMVDEALGNVPGVGQHPATAVPAKKKP